MATCLEPSPFAPALRLNFFHLYPSIPKGVDNKKKGFILSVSVSTLFRT